MIFMCAIFLYAEFMTFMEPYIAIEMTQYSFPVFLYGGEPNKLYCIPCLKGFFIETR